VGLERWVGLREGFALKLPLRPSFPPALFACIQLDVTLPLIPLYPCE
jgi:hypothetical protein